MHGSEGESGGQRAAQAADLQQSGLSVQSGGEQLGQGSGGWPEGQGWPPQLQHSAAQPAPIPSVAASLPAPGIHALL